MKRDTDKSLVLTTSRFIKQRKYWLNKLTGDIAEAKAGLSPGQGRPSTGGQGIETIITEPISDRLIRLSKESDLSVYIILLTALKILLYRYTGSEDITVVSPLFESNVSKETLNDRLWIRDTIHGEMEFRDVLFKIRQSVLEAYENQDYPLDELVKELSGVRREKGIHRFPGVKCLLENIHPREEEEAARRGLVFSFHREFDSRRVTGRIFYNPGVFAGDEAERLASHFTGILTHSLQEVNIKVSAIRFLSEEEKKQLIFTFNNTSQDYPRDKCIHELFEDQVERAPDSIAVVGAHELHELHEKRKLQVHFTYRQLNEKSDQLAFCLIKKGVIPDTVAAVMGERSLEMIIGILGILKAGGAYLPIDPGYPRDRVDYMLKDSGAKILVNNRMLAEEVETVFSSSHLLSPSNLAYVLYTSGSTGRPKGVLVEHYSLVNRLCWMQRKYSINEKDVLLLKAEFSFDVSVMEMFWPLIRGARLCLLEPGGLKELPVLLKAIEKYDVSYLHFLPSMLDRVLDHLEVTGEVNRVSGLKRITVGGEALRPDTVRQFKRVLYDKKGITLHNMYGLTEAAIDVTNYDCPLDGESQRIPMGKPIDNIQIYILDKKMNLQPIGGPGQVYIAGDGLARGYLNNPELTVEKFFPVSYRSHWSYRSYISSKKIYKTGDLGRWLPDGNIEFLGRMDAQVKIRGFRLELGEIENRLIKHEKVKKAVVTHWETGDADIYLCAYIVGAEGEPSLPAQEQEIDTKELKEYLSQSLPAYMVPSYFVQVDEIPLTPNGKVDRRVLPEPVMYKGGTYTAPGDELEKQLVRTWSEVLGIEERLIGIDANFFELGGHSLRAISLMSKIQKEFDVLVPFVEFIKTPVIRNLAKIIKESAKTRFKAIESVEKKEYYVLSAAQKGLYISQKKTPGSIRYNMPNVVELEGEPDRLKLEEIFKRLIKRHEGFRTSFRSTAGEPCQQIHEDVEFEIEYYELAAKDEPAKDREDIIRNFIRPFDLSRVPLLRVGLIKIEDAKYVFMVDMHHIISDGASLNIFIEEFMALYEWRELPVLKIQYKDFAEWQRGETYRQALKKQEEYWLSQYEVDIPQLNIPTDFPGAGTGGFEGSRLDFTISIEEAAALKEFSLREDVTIYMMLLTIYNIFLWKISGCEDIMLGTAVNGRQHPDSEPIIGVFVNLLPLKNRVAKEKTFKEFLLEVKENVLLAFENQDYPFDDLVEKVAVGRDISRNPLFNVFFAFNTRDEKGSRDIRGLTLKHHDFQRYTAKFDLVLFAIDPGESLHFLYEYNSTRFKKETIRRYTRYFKEIVFTLLTNNDIPLKEIKITHELLIPKSSVEQINFNF